MKFLRPAGTPRLDLSMMRFSEILIAFKLDNQPVIRLGLLDAQPGEEWNQKQHRHDRNVVRRRRNLPELVPVLHLKRP